MSKTADNSSLMHNPAALINYSPALKSVYHSLMKDLPHFSSVKRMPCIKLESISTPHPIMSEIHAMPCPPARMILPIPWGNVKSPPYKIRSIHNCRRWRTVN
jgi:hypothetical protein